VPTFAELQKEAEEEYGVSVTDGSCTVKAIGIVGAAKGKFNQVRRVTSKRGLPRTLSKATHWTAVTALMRQSRLMEIR
jgi:hypothetical protein